MLDLIETERERKGKEKNNDFGKHSAYILFGVKEWLQYANSNVTQSV